MDKTSLCRPVPTPVAEGGPDPQDLPDHVMEAMLKRELLLTNAKLHGLGNEHITSERKLRSLRTQLRQVCAAPLFVMLCASLLSACRIAVCC